MATVMVAFQSLLDQSINSILNVFDKTVGIHKSKASQ